jgi:cell division protein FtsX
MQTVLQESKHTSHVSAPEEASLEDVRKALKQQKFLPLKIQKGEWSLAALLLTGLLCFLQIGLLSALQEQIAVRSILEKSVLPLTMQAGATEVQKQTFLQALLSLPHVNGVQYSTKEQQREAALSRHGDDLLALSGGNPFSDRVEVTLRSLGDVSAFFAFLQRSELEPVLSRESLWSLPEWKEGIQAQLVTHRTARMSFLLASLACLALVFLFAFQYLRVRTKGMQKQLRVLRLLGADMWSVQKPLLFELLLLFFGAILLSTLLIFGGGVVFDSFSSSLSRGLLGIVLIEVVLFIGMSFVLLRLVPLPSSR